VGRAFEGSLQTAIVGVIRKMLLEGLRDHDFGRNVSPEVVASTIAWAMRRVLG
jgi:hypothetical protein